MSIKPNEANPQPSSAASLAPSIIPHLTVNDGLAAVAFYRRAFHAEEISCHMAEDGQRVLHCFLAINGGAVMLNDDFPEYHHGQAALAPAGVTIHLLVPDANRAWEQAIAAGAKIVLPIADMPWGDRYGILQDPFGHKWSIGSPLPA